MKALYLFKPVNKTYASVIVTENKDNRHVAKGAPRPLPRLHCCFEAITLLDGLPKKTYLAGDMQFKDFFIKRMTSQIKNGNAFIPPNQSRISGNDEQIFSALAAIAADEIDIRSRSWKR